MEFVVSKVRLSPICDLTCIAASCQCDLTVDLRLKLKHFLSLHLYAKPLINKLLSLSVLLCLHSCMK